MVKKKRLQESKKELNFWKMYDFRSLDSNQRKAVIHGEGPLLVVAGPGSGKTYTLTNRILYLLYKGITPEQILVITYTKDAAESMRHRFQSFSDTSYRSLFIGTFHSLFYNILLENRLIVCKSLLNSKDKTRILSVILETQTKKKLNILQKNEVITLFLKAMEHYKNTLDMEKTKEMFESIEYFSFEELFHYYEEIRTKKGWFDYDDLQFIFYRELKNNIAFYKKYHCKFKYILVDEFQDINPIQYDILKLLTGINGNVFAVGDDDQAIYGFRGTNPNIMQMFKKEFHAKQIILENNYRSGAKIVKASLNVIEGNVNRIVKKLKAGGTNEEDGEVFIHTFPDDYSQWMYLEKRINNETMIGNSCAMLFRTNRNMQKYQQHIQIPLGCKLMTVHGAKGLEFDTVFIPDCNSGMYPYGLEHKNIESEEERRIFYVAMTRAKKCLDLCALKEAHQNSRQISPYLFDIIRQPTRRIRNCPNTHQKHLQRLRTHHRHRYNPERVLRWGRQGFRYICRTIPRRLRFRLFHLRGEEQYSLFRERE